MTRRMIFDVESVGLAGDGFAVGWVVLDGEKEVEHGLFACPCENGHGSPAGLAWIKQNLPHRILNPETSDPIYRATPYTVREAFWDMWQRAGGREIELWGDCAWPVEARFLIDAVDDSRGSSSRTYPCPREMEGPYPLLDISTLFRACRAMGKPVADFSPVEPHNPLEDARASARTLLLCLKSLGITP